MKICLCIYILTFEIESSAFHINNVHSSFQNVISRAPEESLVDPKLLSCFFNDFFYFIDKASVHDFADDNSLSTFESNI